MKPVQEMESDKTFKDRTFDIIVNEIDRIYKEDIRELCPQCKRPIKVIANPSYFCECEFCSWKGKYYDMPIISKKDMVRKLLNEIHPSIF